MVVCATGASLDEATVLAALEGRLARYKTPKRVLFVDELPRNAMGKVQKAALREAYKALYRLRLLRSLRCTRSLVMIVAARSSQNSSLRQRRRWKTGASSRRGSARAASV